MTSETPPYVVMCMKWGTLYGPDYVNVLYNAVADHLDAPFRFVCLTDNPDGFDERIEHFPIPDMGLGEGNFSFGGWPKLSVFQEDLYGLQGRCLFIDLDSIIVGDLLPMFQAQGQICVIREWWRFADLFRKRQVNGATGVFSFTLGAQPWLLQTFLDDPDAATSSFRSEQRFVTAYATDMQFWNADWVISFKRHLMALPVLNRFVKPSEPWPEVKIVAFHGDPRPIHVVPDNDQVWGRKWSRYGRGAVPFVRNYWLKYGGTDPT